MGILILFLFFFSFIAFSIFGFLIVRLITIDVWEDHITDLSIGISGNLLSVLTVFISLPLSFIIIFLWTNYNDTIEFLQVQMNEILIVYDSIKQLNNKTLLQAIQLYIHKKITFKELQKIVYQQNDNSIQYQHIIDKLDKIAYNQFTEDTSVTTELWIVIGIGCLLVIIGTWFLKSPFLLHLYLIISIAGLLGVLVFLVYFYNQLNCYRCIENQLRQELITKINI